jgi:hypothetical protein
VSAITGASASRLLHTVLADAASRWPDKARQLALYLDDESLIVASPAADDPRAVQKAQAESFQVWMTETRSASTALNKHKALAQFFLWLEVDEEEIDQSPMRKARQPSVPTRLIPIIRSGDTRNILLTCRPKSSSIFATKRHPSSLEHRRRIYRSRRVAR